jgi:CBS domain-containing protein
MKIEEIAARDVRICSPENSLAVAAAILRQASCGVLPVVGRDRRVVGMVTDRDVCLALASRNARPAEMKVGEAMSRDVHACRPQDDVSRALGIMGTYGVRRLPVCDDDDHLFGILSIDDVARAAEREPDGALAREVVRTLGRICEAYREGARRRATAA